VLVPEITLTHQILARLRGRFGDGLAVLHSGLSPGERLEQWQRLRAGATPIAVGARSALFAPLERLGVIVLDEEHDSAYKNEEGFRYHARELAARRAAAAACPLVLGSATPSLESRFAADRGGLRRLVLARRIGDRPLPAVSIVDLARERELSPRGRRVVLSGALEKALRETLAAGGQSILLLNRRGFSTQVFCFACGAAERCRHCDIALVYHATPQRLRCHYCDFQIAPPEQCSQCGAPDTSLLGTGTERLEEELRARLPQARLARLDRDTAQQRGYSERVLRELRERRLDILIGTQMVAKGHDFPGVQLVGVVLADVGLHLPDFRAAERTFQLLTQVAGRAGRDRAPGRVIVQTYAPAHPAIRPVRDHDYESFYAEELGQRAALGYPPFGRLVQAVISGEDLDAALAGAQELARAAAAEDGPEILGPAPAPISRLRGRYRFQLLLKGADPERLRLAARRLLEAAGKLPHGVEASLDAFPVNML
jgi:primosomal protein N' (replication factor Y)